MLQKLKLRTRMQVSIGSIAFIAFAVTIAVVAIKASNMASGEARGKAKEMAHRYSGSVKAEVELAMNAARTLARTFEGVKFSEDNPSREMLDRIQEQVLKDNSNFIGVWTCWEPNALDGKDSEYMDAPGHDSTGRYVPYWNKGSGTVAVEPLLDYEVPGAGDYYLLSKNSGKETILDPYKYPIGGKEVLITSLVAPIKHNGVVVGVAGIDISLDTFNGMIASIKPFEDGNAALIANNGTYVSHVDTERAGKDVGTSEQWIAAKTAIKSGNMHTAKGRSEYLATDVERVFVPVQIGHTETPWSFLVNIPTKKVMEKASSIMYTSIFIGFIALSALIFVTFLISKGIADPLNQIIDRMTDGSEQMTSASQQVAATGQQIAEATGQQAASLEETSSSLEEMASMTSQNADNANQANVLAKDASDAAQNGNRSIQQLNSAMSEISSSSEETAKIVKTIEDIAFQTNLLALNAAVEAARAGEAGSGFAVVAEEVRNLAQRAGDAARDTGQLISESTSRIENGVKIAQESAGALEEINTNVQKVSNLLGEISASSKEQAQGINQVNEAVTQMDGVVQANAASSEESASAGNELSSQARQLSEMVHELMVIVGDSRANKSKPINIA